MTILLCLAIAVGSAAATDCGSTSRLSVQIPWFSQPQFAGFEVPNHKVSNAPTYGSECLRVQVRPGGPDFDPIEELMTDRADVALAEGAYIAQNINNGKELTVIANYFQRSAIGIAGLDKSITSLQQLAGKKVGVWCCGYDIPIRQMLMKMNIDAEIVDQSFSMNQLYDGEIDMASVMIYNELAMLTQKLDDSTNFLKQGSDLSQFTPSEFDVPYLHGMMVVKTNRLPELRDRLVRFLKVVSRTWIFCRDNEYACVYSYPQGSAHFEWQMREVNRLVFPSPGGLGVTSLHQWNEMDSYLASSGVIPNYTPVGPGVIDNSLILDALADLTLEQQQIIVAPNHADTVKFCAAYGTESYWVCDVSSFEHTLCPAGRYPTGPVDGDCSECPAGRSSSDPLSLEYARMLTCKACPEGQAQVDTGRSFCTICPAGTYSDTNGTVCEPCKEGSYSSAVQVTTCQQCPAGSFTDTAGETVCTNCLSGTFVAEPGSTVCIPCQHKQITLKHVLLQDRMQWVPFEGATSAESCGCGAGMRESGDRCETCGEGLDCHGKDDILIQRGYYAADMHFSIYRCRGNANRCSGGAPGECAKGREGISCASCVSDYTPEDDGTCKECGGSDIAPFVIFTLVCFLLLVAVYYIIDTQDATKKSHASMLAALTISLCVALVQQLGVISMMSVAFPSPLNHIFGVIRILTFDIEILRLGCVMTTSALSRYAIKIFLIVIFIIVLLLIHVAFVLGRYGGKFKQRMPSLYGVIGTIFMICYISVLTCMFGPFQCVENPNETYTLRGYPSVVCWDTDEHVGMVAIAFVASIVPLSFLVGCCVLVWKFPAKMKVGDTLFLRSFAFLFFRYRPDAYWYALVHILRSLFLSICPIIPRIVAQFLVTHLIVLGQMLATAIVLPWRVYHANVLEIVLNLGVEFFLCTSAFFVDEEDLEVVAWLGVAIFLSMVLWTIPMFMYSFYRYQTSKQHKEFSQFICHHKAGAGSFARVLKIGLKSNSAIRGKVFIDSDDLQDISKLFDYAGHCTENFIIVCSKEINQRPWCMGEMVNASANHVKSVKVVFPDYVPPTEDFIRDYAINVPEITNLSRLGVSLDMVQAALQWASNLPAISMPQLFSHDVHAQLVEKLSAGAPTSSHVLSVSKANFPAHVTTAVLVDYTFTEATASALVLTSMIAPLMSSKPEMMPSLLPKGEELPLRVNRVLVVCTTSAFHCHELLRALIAAAALNCEYLPIVTDDGFRFPTAGFFEQFRSSTAPVTGNADMLIALIQELFKAIAIVFQPAEYSSTEAILQVKAAEIANRLVVSGALSKLSVSATLPTPTGEDNKMMDVKTLGDAHSKTLDIIV